MKSDIEKLEWLVSHIQVSPARTFLSGPLLNAYDPMWYCGGKRERFLCGEFRSIFQDIWGLLTLIHRIEWMRRLALKDENARELWRSYTAADINSFHTETRSIFDYSARIIGCSGKKPNQARAESFSELVGWLGENPGNAERLGPALSQIVQSAAPWFSEIRAIRNQIVHHGAFTLVFAEPDKGILFQIHGLDPSEYLSFKPVMFNEHVADFQLYCALVMARLFHFLNQVAVEVKRVFGKGGFPGDGTMESIGLDNLKCWSERLLLALKAIGEP
jgi:hypothetical protein